MVSTQKDISQHTYKNKWKRKQNEKPNWYIYGVNIVPLLYFKSVNPSPMLGQIDLLYHVTHDHLRSRVWNFDKGYQKIEGCIGKKHCFHSTGYALQLRNREKEKKIWKVN